MKDETPKVSGQVVNLAGVHQGIPAVGVKIDGVGVSAATDKDGRFALRPATPPRLTLIFDQSFYLLVPANGDGKVSCDVDAARGGTCDVTMVERVPSDPKVYSAAIVQSVITLTAPGATGPMARLGYWGCWDEIRKAGYSNLGKVYLAKGLWEKRESRPGAETVAGTLCKAYSDVDPEVARVLNTNVESVAAGKAGLLTNERLLANRVDGRVILDMLRTSAKTAPALDRELTLRLNADVNAFVKQRKIAIADSELREVYTALDRKKE